MAGIIWFQAALMGFRETPWIWGHRLLEWAIVACGMILIGGLAFVADRKRRITAYRRIHGLCSACGYDLRATPDRCPECGTIPLKKEVISN